MYPTTTSRKSEIQAPKLPPRLLTILPPLLENPGSRTSCEASVTNRYTATTTTSRNSDSNNRRSSFSGNCEFDDLRALRAKLEFPSRGTAKSLFQIIFIASTPKLIRNPHADGCGALRYARPSLLGLRSSQPHVDRL